jgi:hypothetical protein
MIIVPVGSPAVVALGVGGREGLDVGDGADVAPLGEAKPPGVGSAVDGALQPTMSRQNMTMAVLM